MFNVFKSLTREGRIDRLVCEMHTAGFKLVDHTVVCGLCSSTGERCDMPETLEIYQAAYNALQVGASTEVPWSERLLSWLFHFSL